MPEARETPGGRPVDIRGGLARERVRAQLFGGEAAAATIDRFTLLECIGSGGMGTVYAAYDPRLDRRIALKLLRDDVDVGTGGGRERQGRLLREARAMAKLSHPNVGAVHDVGAVAQGPEVPPMVWIAMEFIDGEGLRAWCTRATPPAVEILDAYLQMGRGLAAAHAAGLVHRDVKPDNAMRDRTGRVRVLDFGLARPALDDGEHTAVDLAVLAGVDIESFTQTGALVGTPAYMAPEQFDGRLADARTDQYGFCVALFEALWCVRPHGGSSSVALAEERRRGRVVEPPRRRDVPGGVRAILLRGLQPDPAGRWASMDALLHALERRRTPRGRLVLGSLAAVVAVGVAVAVTAGAPSVCGDARDAVAGTWDRRAREAVRAAFSADARPFVPAVTDTVIAALDGYTVALGDAYHDACIATHGTRVQSSALLDRRTTCLDGRRARVRALVEVLEGADAALVERATIAVAALDPIETCADGATLLAVDPPDAASASAVADVEADLARAAAVRSAARLAQARGLAADALVRAQEIGYRPLLARAHLESAMIHDALGEAEQAVADATEAHFVGLATAQYELAARAAAIATGAVPAASANRALAALWHRAGVGAADELEDGELARAELDVALGTYLMRLQDPDAAYEALSRGLEIRRRRLGADAVEVWDVELSTARVLVARQRIDEAHAVAVAAEVRAEDQLAEDPVRLAAALGSIAELYQFTGDLAAAEPVAERALALAEANLGADHPSTNVIRVDLAALHYRAGRRQVAADLLAVAVASTERRGDGEGNARASHLHAIVLKGLRRYDEALAAESRSLSWYREHTPESPRSLVIGELTLGNIHLLRDDNAAAEAAYLAAIELVERHGITERAIAVQSDYANFLFQTGRAAEAVTRLESMLAQMRADQSPPYELAQYEFDLARALWRAGDDRARAKAVATAVLQVLRTESPTPQVAGHIRRDWTVADVEEWFPDPDAWEND